ncbi:calcium-dependent kinase [Olea europaea subsp. europaea]|uniref:Calcium-dependent kinase n=2 Tax=Olea europaea subsp. europaea TaxID=158383 RepID=A0A8S0VNL9_OLEEU|nr:calcium-dependent kinase [Olea europaea subsp. europaea]
MEAPIAKTMKLYSRVVTTTIPAATTTNNKNNTTAPVEKFFKLLLTFFIMLGLSGLVLYQYAYPSPFYQRSYSQSFSPRNPMKENQSSPSRGALQGNKISPSNDTTPGKQISPGNDDKTLEKVLDQAAMEDKTVIITTLNAAWTEPNSIFDFFLESFTIGNGTKNLLKHVIVIAFDAKAYFRCLAVHTNCYALKTEGIDFADEAIFMTKDYLKMMWTRIDFLISVLEIGYNFVFTDADVMWLRNPFHRFYSNVDFQIACDHYWFNSTDLHNSPNGGFNYVRSNNRTIQFYKFWYKSKDKFPGKHDQDVLNMIKFDPFINKIGLEIRFLDTAYFGGFCEPSKDLNLVCTMHANCCIGLDNKIHDLKMVIDDWKNYMSMPGHEKFTKIINWTVPRRCF